MAADQLLDLSEAEMTLHEREQLKALIAEKARRQMEAIKLWSPLPIQDQVHQCQKRRILAEGSNRAGKTLVIAMDVGRGMTGQDPYKKYPTTGRGIIVGKNEFEIGTVLYPKLFEEGAFKIIRDKNDGRMRAFRPWHKSDLDREHLAEPAPPIIPPRFIKHTSWKRERDKVPYSITLWTGWEIYFGSARNKPFKGFSADWAWLDEEADQNGWYKEMVARLIDSKGRLFWSATAEVATQQFRDLQRRAAKGDPLIGHFKLLLADNLHIDAQSKKEFESDLDKATARVKVHGQSAYDERRVFPEFSETIHACDDFAVPSEWTRHLCIDPGHQVCAVEFLAVPPPAQMRTCQQCRLVTSAADKCERCNATLAPRKDTHSDHVYMYDELYIEKCDAWKFAAAMQEKCGEQTILEFMIDLHSARQHETGGGMTTEEYYTMALAEKGIKSVHTGAGFRHACDVVETRLQAIRGWLKPLPSGIPKLRIMRNRCPNLIAEMENYIYKVAPDGTITSKPRAKHDHAIFCLGGLAVRSPTWVKLDRHVAAPSPAYTAFLKKQRAKAGNSLSWLAPPS